jgi:DNA polymerase-3 subunit epsilon
MDPRQRCVALDLETTGLIPGLDRIVELGAVAFTLADGVQGEYEALVDPGIPIPAAAARVSGISDEMVRGRPPVAEELPRFLAFLGPAVPVAHNAAFDGGFLAADIARLGLAAEATPVLDTRALARAALPGRQSYALDALCRDLGITGWSAHRALGDAHRCRLLFLACLERLEAAGRPTSGDALAVLEGPPMDLGSRAPAIAMRVATLARAIEGGRDVEIEYVDAARDRTSRRIQPRSFAIRGGSPALVAFCRLRGAERTFLVESIREIRTL